MELRQLAAFEAIARTGSFHAAAEDLHITQPAVSSRLQALEGELGVQLFDRRGKSVQLTMEGIEFLKVARQVVTLAGKMKAAARGLEAPSGEVRIGLSNLLLIEQHRHIHALAREHFPGRPVEIHVDSTTHLHRLLMHRMLDISIGGRVREPSIESTFLHAYPSVWIASPGLKLARRRYLLPDLADHSIVTYSAQSATYAYIRSLQERLGFQRQHLIACDSTATILQMVADGAGIGTAIGPRAHREIAEGRLQLLDVDVHIPNSELLAYHHVGADPSVTAFVAAIAEALYGDDAGQLAGPAAIPAKPSDR